MLVRTGKGKKAEKILQAECKAAIPVFDDLATAVTDILK
jgi:hypothetical protein